jgi:Rab GDP dissociation inhibitor
LYTPTADGKQDNIFITKSYDATTHFETVAEDVADVWERITVSFPPARVLGALGHMKS